MRGYPSWRVVAAFWGVLLLSVQAVPVTQSVSHARAIARQDPAKVADPVAVELNGVVLGSLGALIDGWTFVNADLLVPLLGGEIAHVPGAPNATILLHGKTLTLAVGQNTMRIGHRTVPLQASPRLIDQAIYVPLSELVKGSDTVDWSEATKTVDLVPAASAALVIPRLQSPPVAIEANGSVSTAVVAPSALSSAPAQPASTATASEASSAVTVPQSTLPASARSSATATVAPSNTDAVPPPSAADVLLVARVIDSELSSGPFEAQVGIGAVIRNRMLSPHFADTLDGVVYEPGQFQGVGSPLFDAQPSATVLAAARDALEGQDPTEGALYFYNPGTTSSAWALSLQTTVTIGPIRFAK